MSSNLLIVGGVAVAAVVLVERARRATQARWWRSARGRLTARKVNSFGALVERQRAIVLSSQGLADLSPVFGEWFDVMERDPAAHLRRSGADGNAALAERDAGSAATLARTWAAYDAYTSQVFAWRAGFESPDPAEVLALLQATAAALDAGRFVAVELPPKTSTLDDAAEGAGELAAGAGNLVAGLASQTGKLLGQIGGGVAKGFTGGASETLVVVAGLALLAVFLLPRVLP